MISTKQRTNAERIVALADRFGQLPLNSAGQTPSSVLDLSIPCARLVVAGVVTGVDPDTCDGVSDLAVAEVEHRCRQAIEHALPLESYNAELAYRLVHQADELGLELPATLKQVAFEARCGHGLVAA